MKYFSKFSIKWKLFVLLLVSSLFGSLSTGLFFVFNDLKILRGSLVRNIEITSRVVGLNSRAAMLFNDPKAGNRVLSSLSIDPQITAAFLLDNKGDIFASYGSVEGKSPDVEKIKSGPIGWDDKEFAIAKEITFKKKQVGTIVVFVNLIEYERLVSDYKKIVGIAFLFTAILSGILAFLFQRIISRPILELAKTSDLISLKNDYSIRANPDSNENEDEISILFRAFNQMLTQIEKRDSELLLYRDHLESRVVERTRELSNSNKLLVKEIEERRAAQESLKRRIDEKEVLLKEINHRAKNNMQILSSMMWLQAEELGGGECAGRFKECATRITSMALVHEKVFGSENVSEIRFLEYLHDLCKSLVHTLDSPKVQIDFEVEGDNVSVDIDKAISCGLIAHELIANCLKHAFEGKENGKIVVGFRAVEGGKFLLKVADNGVGMKGNPETSFSPGLGLELVRAIAEEKLKGSLEICNDRETEVTITFPNQ